MCSPRPNNVLSGRGICQKCAGQCWDVFYVVRNELTDSVKFGVTSGNPKPRLYEHARDGYDQLLRLHEGLPEDTAGKLERTILAALRDAREQPIRGREYFPARVLPVVLDLVDSHLDLI